MAGAPDDDLKQLHDALLRACEDYDADEAIRALGSAAVAIIGRPRRTRRSTGWRGSCRRS
jgi:hypothetical protein